MSPHKSLLTAVVFALLGLPLHGQVTAVSNLAQTFSTTHTVGDSGGKNFRDAISFTTGATVTDFSSITVYGFGGGSIADFSINLYSGIGGAGPTGLIASTTGTANPSSLQNYVYTTNAPATLLANSTYWVVASAPTAPASAFFAWRSTNSTAEDGGVLSGWSLGDTRWASLNGGTSWSGLGGAIPQFSVQVSAIPEPSTYAVFTGLAALGWVAFRRRTKMDQANQRQQPHPVRLSMDSIRRVSRAKQHSGTVLRAG